VLHAVVEETYSVRVCVCMCGGGCLCVCGRCAAHSHRTNLQCYTVFVQYYTVSHRVITVFLQYYTALHSAIQWYKVFYSVTTMSCSATRVVSRPAAGNPILTFLFFGDGSGVGRGGARDDQHTRRGGSRGDGCLSKRPGLSVSACVCVCVCVCEGVYVCVCKCLCV
jgi:hypothetical protein